MIMKNFKQLNSLLAIIVLTLIISSCKQLYYQVYDIQATNLVEQENAIIYENEDLKILYNFWTENGIVGFILENKTDNDLFVDMSQTFFILNGEAHDYYEKIITEKKIVCIPEKAYKVFCKFNISPELTITYDTKLDLPKTERTVKSFNENNSPIKFNNRITYSFDKECNNIKQINNNFYVSKITNYNHKVATSIESISIRNLDFTRKEYFKIGKPSRFYIKYNQDDYYYYKLD